MQRGDLSNDIPQRIIFLWEHTVGYMPPSNEHRETRMVKTHRWDKAVDCWGVNEFAVHRIWDLWSRYNLRCDLAVISRPESFSEALAERMDAEDVPVRHVVSVETSVLARKLIHMPDVVRVVFGDPSLQFAFGAKGRYMAHDGSADFILN